MGAVCTSAIGEGSGARGQGQHIRRGLDVDIYVHTHRVLFVNKETAKRDWWGRSCVSDGLG